MSLLLITVSASDADYKVLAKNFGLKTTDSPDKGTKGKGVVIATRMTIVLT
jgi:hypothetical protein